MGITVEWLCYLVGVGIIAVSMLLVMNADLVGGILGPVGLLMFFWLVFGRFWF